tara:strand:+ start:651 stop:830 length:180 start_codon:yes stop_codon:yes gene_type:complete
MAKGVVFACANALANAFSHRDRISERELEIYVRTEYGQNWQWAKHFYEIRGRFPQSREV